MKLLFTFLSLLLLINNAEALSLSERKALMAKVKETRKISRNTIHKKIKVLRQSHHIRKKPKRHTIKKQNTNSKLQKKKVFKRPKKVIRR